MNSSRGESGSTCLQTTAVLLGAMKSFPEGQPGRTRKNQRLIPSGQTCLEYGARRYSMPFYRAAFRLGVHTSSWLVEKTLTAFLLLRSECSTRTNHLDGFARCCWRCTFPTLSSGTHRLLTHNRCRFHHTRLHHSGRSQAFIQVEDGAGEVTDQPLALLLGLRRFCEPLDLQEHSDTAGLLLAAVRAVNLQLLAELRRVDEPQHSCAFEAVHHCNCWFGVRFGLYLTCRI